MRGNPHAAFDVAGVGNVAWSRWCDTRRRKGEPTGNTNIDLNRRVSPRPYAEETCLASRTKNRDVNLPVKCGAPSSRFGFRPCGQQRRPGPEPNRCLGAISIRPGRLAQIWLSRKVSRSFLSRTRRNMLSGMSEVMSGLPLMA